MCRTFTFTFNKHAKQLCLSIFIIFQRQPNNIHLIVLRVSLELKILEILPDCVVNLLSLLANIAVINQCKPLFLYFSLISFFSNFQIFLKTFPKLCCGNFPSFRKLFWKLPETAWEYSTLTVKFGLHIIETYQCY